MAYVSRAACDKPGADASVSASYHAFNLSLTRSCAVHIDRRFLGGMMALI